MAKRDEEQKRRLRGEHLESYTQDAPIGALSKIPDIQRGLKQWGPDLAALPGDLLDMLAYAGRKVARGQSERSVPSLGAGAATRGALSKAPKRQQTELSERKDPSMVEEAVRFMNPMMWGNPLKIAQGPLGKVMAMMGGDLSGMTGVIKGKGGNWHPELDPRRALEPLMRARNMSLEDAARLGKKDPMQKITPEDLKLVQPYVQDFLNSQEWSDIHDLSNAGLHDMRSLYGRDLPQGAKRFMTPAEQQEFNKLYPDLESQMSKDLKAGDWEPDEHIEFAQGGLVRAPDYFDNLDVFLRG